MMVKATLQIVLKANELVVAESDDAALWQQILASITGAGRCTTQAHELKEQATPRRVPRKTEPSSSEPERIEWSTGALESFASDLRLDPTLVQAACEPTSTPPYLHLDDHAWEDFKRNTAARGKGAVPQIGLAATLLLLWFRRSQSGSAKVTISQAQEVLKTIGQRDKNATRGLKNCRAWLQTRDDNTIQLNPTRLTRALSLARAFCSHEPIEEREPDEKG